MTSDAQTALIAQLKTPGNLSKTYRMTVMGLIAVLLVLLILAVVFILQPTVAGAFVTAAATGIAAIGVMVAGYAGSHAVVDTKTVASLAA